MHFTGPRNQTASVGDTVEFACWVKGSPSPQTSIVFLGRTRSATGGAIEGIEEGTRGGEDLRRDNGGVIVKDEFWWWGYGKISHINVTNIIR